ncbi:hypothetical protein AeNC1_011469 [Aphanomyces euteiches]|nr:hypothetical protein AeNC1_011469 [Aphanomyces euteiches]
MTSVPCTYPGWPECFGNPLERTTHATETIKRPPNPPVIKPSLQDHTHSIRILRGRPHISTEQVDYLIQPPQCAFQVTCKRAIATRKCFDCIKFDPQRNGHYCDACFQVRHPKTRLEHKWTYLRDEVDSKAEWIQHLIHHNGEQECLELGDVLDLTRSIITVAANASNEPLEVRVNQAMDDIESIDAGVRRLKGHVNHSLRTQNLTRADAAKKIQDAWKLFKARKLFRQLIRSVYERLEDPLTGKVYYYNKRTETTQWSKPLGLGSEDYVPVKRIIKAAHLTLEHAARYIQRAFRSRQARAKIRALIHRVYRKVRDPATGLYYYYNKQTGAVSWTKPKLLGSDDIYADDEKPPKQKSKTKQKPLTPEVAVIRIQRMYRCAAARKELRALISRVYIKIWDASRGQFYFYNTVTQVVTWAKPKWVDESELMSPRAHQEFIAREEDTLRRQKLEAIRNSSSDEAAQFLQRLVRRRLARRKLQKMLADIYEAILDPTTGQYFYHNKKTGDVSWSKPTLLERNALG